MPVIKNSGMGNYEKLKELIPIYIITFFSLVAGILNTLLEQDLIWAIIAFFIIIGFAAGFTFYVEKVRRKIPISQTIFAMINGVLWIFVTNMKIFNFGIIAETFIALIAVIWTFVLTFEYKS